MRIVTTTALTLLSLLIGCGKKAPGGGNFADVEAKVAEVNAKVPEAQKAALTFKAAKVDKDRLGALVPANWDESKVLPGSYQPAGETVQLGFLTRYSVGSNCDGTCESKSWATVVANNEFDVPRGTVVKDEAIGAEARLLIKDQEGTLVIRFARWKQGASRYYYCKATLEPDARATIDAIEAACRALTPLRW